jgi:hypothetical protein
VNTSVETSEQAVRPRAGLRRSTSLPRIARAERDLDLQLRAGESRQLDSRGLRAEAASWASFRLRGEALRPDVDRLEQIRLAPPFRPTASKSPEDSSSSSDAYER